jgi:hypothetical protein
MITIQSMIILETFMTNAAANSATAKPENAAEMRQIVLKEISAKWGQVLRAGSIGVEMTSWRRSWPSTASIAAGSTRCRRFDEKAVAFDACLNNYTEAAPGGNLGGPSGMT